MKPPPAVVDTNVLVAGILTSNPDAPTARLMRGMLSGAFVYLLSVELVDEYRRVLLRPAIRERHGLPVEEVDAVLAELCRRGAVRTTTGGATAPDPGDQHLWDLLASQPEVVLVTGDRRLFDVASPALSVVGPADFLALLKDSGRGERV